MASLLTRNLSLLLVLLMDCLVGDRFVYAIESEQDASKSDSQTPKQQQHHHWNYNNQTDWSNEYPLCKGKALRQSPIDIITANVETRNKLMVEFVDYNQNIQVKAQNTEHSVCVKPNLDSLEAKPEVRLSWLPDGGEFELEEVHFHWGDMKTKGSEHKIDGVRAAAEMHMVHFKKGLAASEIGNIENSVVVVGVFIESSSDGVGSSSSLDQLIDFFLDWLYSFLSLGFGAELRSAADTKTRNKELEYIIEETSSVNGTDRSKLVPLGDKNENLQDLLPDNLDQFFTYNGSLTTPPCFEVVTWVVLKSPIYMSEEKLEKLSNLATTDSNGMHRISKNFREIQPLLDRPVYSSLNISRSVSSIANKNSH